MIKNADWQVKIWIPFFCTFDVLFSIEHDNKKRNARSNSTVLVDKQKIEGWKNCIYIQTKTGGT